MNKEIEKRILPSDKQITNAMSVLIAVLESQDFKVISDFSLGKDGRIDIGHVEWERK